MINMPVPRFANPADFFMKVLSIRYPKQKEDEEKLAYLSRNYHALLEGSVKAENKLIKIEAPDDVSEDYQHMADVGT
jgi:hypothetical protein